MGRDLTTAFLAVAGAEAGRRLHCLSSQLLLFLTVKESDLYYVSGGYVADQKRENIVVEANSFSIVGWSCGPILCNGQNVC